MINKNSLRSNMKSLILALSIVMLSTSCKKKEIESLNDKIVKLEAQIVRKYHIYIQLMKHCGF